MGVLTYVEKLTGKEQSAEHKALLAMKKMDLSSCVSGDAKAPAKKRELQAVKPKEEKKDDKKADSGVKTAFTHNGGVVVSTTDPFKKGLKIKWSGYVGMGKVKNSGDNKTSNWGLNVEKCTVAQPMLNEMLLKNSKSTLLKTTFEPIWKAIGAGFNMGANAEAKASFGAFTGSFIDTGFKLEGKAKGKAKASAGIKVKVGVKAKASAKSRRLQSLNTAPKYTTSKDGMNVDGSEYRTTGITLSTSLSHEGMVAVAASYLMNTMIAMLAVFYALF